MPRQSRAALALLGFLAMLTATTDAQGPPTSTPHAGAPEIPDTEAFTELRFTYARQAGYSPFWNDDPEREAAIKAYKEGKADEFLSLSDRWLKSCPVDARLHLMRAVTLLEKGDVRGHFYHRYAYYGLMASLAASGDGRSKDSAYKVIAVEEEYTLMNHIGAKLDQQTLQYPCDVMEVTIDGKAEILYFDVSLPMAAIGPEPRSERKEKE